MKESCFLAQFSREPCEGQLRRVHLIEKQALKRRGHDPWDPHSYVLGCGGPWPGLAGHHGAFDAYKLVVPREALPAAVEELAAELRMVFYLDRRYGVLVPA